MKHGCRIVVQPDNNSSNPVAKGSRVPAWPVRAPVRRRSSATSAKDDGPAGLSARTMPAGLSPLGGTSDELLPDELGDLADRRVARESGCLPVAAAPAGARDRGDVDLVARGAQRDAPRGSVGARRLADERGYLRAL